jgi:hypothetical protein
MKSSWEILGHENLSKQASKDCCYASLLVCGVGNTFHVHVLANLTKVKKTLMSQQIPSVSTVNLPEIM